MARKINSPNEKAKQAEHLEFLRKKDRETVRGIFRYYEVPGGRMQFNYRGHDGDPVELYDMKDGEMYTIPLGVARHLNKNGVYPEYEYGQERSVDGGKSTVVHKISRNVHRFGFQSLEFVDVEEMNAPHKEVVLVETVGA